MRFAAIADDLTGAVELASYLVRAGVPARVLTSRATAEDAEGCPAPVFGLKIRTVPKRVALKAVGRALDILSPLGPRQIFYKYCATFDSTPRGNIGPIADLLAHKTGADFTAFCPAFPEVDRTVYRGHLFAADALISRSPKRFDPLTPMREPDLVRVLQAQTKATVGLIRSKDYAGGVRTVSTRVTALRAQGVTYAICDATSEADLEVLAEATVDWPLMTGGSSVAVYYPQFWRARGEIEGAETLPLPKIDGLAAVLAGSCAERTEEQIRAFEQHRPVLRLAVEDIMADPATVEQALSWSRAHLAAGPVTIATTSPPDRVAAAQERFGRRRAAEAVEHALGRIACGLREQGVRRFLVAGGETSGAILDHLGVRAMQSGAFEAPGLARTVSTGADPMSFHLKSGKLGPASMFLDVTR
jgi:uncharacterized protein YgbK (DUF1537 family)